MISLIKSVDIIWVGIEFLIFGTIISSYADYIFGEFIETSADKTPTWKLTLQVFIHFAMIILAVYMIKYLIHIIPSPFNGLWGYNHDQLIEADTGSVVLSFCVYLYHPELRARMIYLANRYRTLFGIRKMRDDTSISTYNKYIEQH